MGRRYNETELLDIIREFYDENGFIPSTSHIQQSTTIISRFGSWKNAIESAGLDSSLIPRRKHKEVSRDEAVSSLQDFFKQHGRSPLYTELKSCYGLFSLAIYQRVFDGLKWGKILERCQLPPVDKTLKNPLRQPRAVAITKQKAIHSLRDFYKKNGRIPTSKETCSFFGLYSLYSYQKAFHVKTWREIISEANLPVKKMKLIGKPKRYYLTKQEVLDSLRKFYADNQRFPIQRELVRSKGLFSQGTCLKVLQCADWKQVIELVKKGNKQKSDQELIKTITDFFEEHGSAPKIRQVKEARTIILRFGTWNNALKIAGLPTRRDVPTKTMLRQSLMDFYLKNGRPPKVMEATPQHGLSSREVYFNVIGVDAWPDVLAWADLKKFREKPSRKLMSKKKFQELLLKRMTEYAGEKNISIAEAAESCRISVRDLKNGDISLRQLADVCQLLDVDVTFKNLSGIILKSKV